MEDILDLDTKVNQYFSGRVVRKDLTKTMKQGYNVPVYVLEYLLGMYCATDDEETLNAICQDNKMLMDEFLSYLASIQRTRETIEK